MKLHEALEDVIAHPCRRALVMSYGKLYFDPTYADDGLRLLPNPPPNEVDWSACGFGAPVFNVDDARGEHTVVDVEVAPFNITRVTEG